MFANIHQSSAGKKRAGENQADLPAAQRCQEFQRLSSRTDAGRGNSASSGQKNKPQMVSLTTWRDAVHQCLTPAARMHLQLTRAHKTSLKQTGDEPGREDTQEAARPPSQLLCGHAGGHAGQASQDDVIQPAHAAQPLPQRLADADISHVTGQLAEAGVEGRLERQEGGV